MRPPRIVFLALLFWLVIARAGTPCANLSEFATSAHRLPCNALLVRQYPLRYPFREFNRIYLARASFKPTHIKKNAQARAQTLTLTRSGLRFVRGLARYPHNPMNIPVVLLNVFFIVSRLQTKFEAQRPRGRKAKLYYRSVWRTAFPIAAFLLNAPRSVCSKIGFSKNMLSIKN